MVETLEVLFPVICVSLDAAHLEKNMLVGDVGVVTCPRVRVIGILGVVCFHIDEHHICAPLLSHLQKDFCGLLALRKVDLHV